MYTVEKTWTSKEGYICVAIAVHDLGHRCGYVGVPKTHAFYGKAYYDSANCTIDDMRHISKEEPQVGKRGPINLFMMDTDNLKVWDLFDVHGSITYSGGNGYPIEHGEDVWFFGFDCDHHNDLKDLSILAGKRTELYKVRNELLQLDGAEVRTLDYVIDECNRLSEQLAMYNRNNLRQEEASK